ncbi:peptidyl-prolyl cis-trans isomerase-like 3 isoform 1-T1 [Pluvialis apricaria]
MHLHTLKPPRGIQPQEEQAGPGRETLGHRQRSPPRPPGRARRCRGPCTHLTPEQEQQPGQGCGAEPVPRPRRFRRAHGAGGGLSAAPAALGVSCGEGGPAPSCPPEGSRGDASRRRDVGLGPASAGNRCMQIYLRFLIADMAVTLHTDVGDIKIELFCERTPKTCENFLALCASNYYNGCVFHRNIKGFMVQTGDPLGTGKGGNSIWGKKFEDEFSEYLKHSVRGVVSMANNGPNTNGSQFFITYGKQPHLDMKYTVFGKVIDGLETLDELEKLPVNEKTYRPLNDVRIKDITIHANPFAL